MELKHIIGYSPERCATLKWSRKLDENIMLFTSSGTIIAMDVGSKEQKRFYFGHTAPICCFDVSPDGSMVASA
jgi:WD40 repeat protein